MLMASFKLPLLIISLTLILHCGKREDSPLPAGREKSAVGGQKHETKHAELVECPVCGLEFEKSEAAYTYRYNNCDYYFLLEDHQKAFAHSCKERLGSRPPNLNPPDTLCSPETLPHPCQ